MKGNQSRIFAWPRQLLGSLVYSKATWDLHLLQASQGAPLVRGHQLDPKKEAKQKAKTIHLLLPTLFKSYWDNEKISNSITRGFFICVSQILCLSIKLLNCTNLCISTFHNTQVPGLKYCGLETQNLSIIHSTGPQGLSFLAKWLWPRRTNTPTTPHRGGAPWNGLTHSFHTHHWSRLTRLTGRSWWPNATLKPRTKDKWTEGNQNTKFRIPNSA